MHFQGEYAWLSIWHIISQQLCETELWFQRTTYRKLHIRSPMVTWLTTSRDWWRRDPKIFEINISTTVQDTWSVHIDYQYETIPWESSGHMTDDVTWPERSRSWPQYISSLISQTPCEMAGLLQNLHTMVPTWACIHDMLKVKVRSKVTWHRHVCNFTKTYVYKGEAW